MTVKVYQYKKCSTCVKALKFLKEHKIAFTSCDITETPPTINELKKMLQYKNGEIKKLFNTSGIAYRELKLSERIKEIKEEEALELLSQNGKLVKRPFLLTENFGLVGFKENEWEEVFSQ